MRLFTYTGLSVFLSFNYAISSNAQSMNNLFLRLPEGCTPGLTKSDRKLLIDDGEYLVSASHTNKTTSHSSHQKHPSLDYSIDTVTDNYLAYEYSNSKGQGSYAAYEIKRFKTNKGGNILVFSKNCDTKATTNKFDLKIYTITDTSLVETKEHFLPDKLDYSVFLRNTTPDSVKSSIEKSSLCTYDLDMDATNKIISYIILGSEQYKKWLAGNVIELKWTGSAFTGAVSFQKE
jgi:hypothetical protein